MTRRRRVLAAGGVAVGALVPAYLLLPPIGDVSGSALQWSLAREIDESPMEDEPCERKGRVWMCAMWYEVNSGGVSYRLTRDGRCWDAKLTARGEWRMGMPDRGHGCVRLRDQLRLGVRLWNLVLE